MELSIKSFDSQGSGNERLIRKWYYLYTPKICR